MSHAAAVPTLTEAELLDAYARGACPRRVRIRPSSRVLRLLALPHHSLEIVAEAPGVGDLVVFPGRSKLAWRRVLEVRGDELRVRSEVAPRDDGWVDARRAIGRARTVPSIGALAAIAPSAWTRGLYAMAVLLAHARTHAARIRRRRGGLDDYGLRVLTEGDRALYARFHELRSDADGVTRELPPACLAPIAVGLFSSRGELIGTVLMAWPSPADCYFHALFVAPSARGRGGAARLKAFAIRTAKECGARRAYSYVHARNAPCIAANVRAGMHLTGAWLTEGDDPMSAMTHQLVEMAVEL